MGLFSFGASKSTSEQRSNSSSFDNMDASGFNFGRSGSGSIAESGGSSSQSVAFEDVFAKLFGGAGGAAGGVDTGAITGAANSLFTSGGGFLDQLADGGAGADFMKSRLNDGGALANEQIGLLGEDIDKFLTESVLPGIKSDGVVASTLGGSRGEVSKGIAGEGALDAFRRGATDIRVRDQAAKDSIAGQLAADESARAGTGLGSLGDMFSLFESGQFAGLSPFDALSQILGAPTVLGESSDFSSALSEAFGFDIGGSSQRGRAGSESSSSGSSSSKAFNFGPGE